MYDLFGQPEALALLMMGLVALSFGVLFRIGYLRRWAAITRSSAFPRYMRNGPFSMAPFGATLLLWWGAIAIGETGHAVLATYVAIASIPTFFIGIYILLAGPAWSKPVWLRADRARPSLTSPRLSSRQYAAAWVVVGLGAAAWLAFGFGVAALAIASIFVVPVLIALRPRSPGRHGPGGSAEEPYRRYG